MSDPKILYQPADLRKCWRIADFPLARLVPLNESAVSAIGNDPVIADLTADDHLVVYFSSRAFWPYFGVKARISVMMLEPAAIQPRHYFVLPLFQRKFEFILSHSARVAGQCRNAVFFNPHCITVGASSSEKTKHISLIASKKKELAGHRLRHVIAERCRDHLDLYGRAYKFIQSKSVALSDYRFSVSIENSRASGYFIEKILDCFMTRTVPIYWGDPDINRHFNAAGIIACNSAEDIVRTVETVTEADYHHRLAAIEDNFERVQAYLSMEQKLATCMRRLVGRTIE